MTQDIQVTKPKRKVSYNQDAVLCPACKKRIRLNNNGRLRVHIAGKVGSGKCMFSDSDPFPPAQTTILDNTISLESKSGSIMDLIQKDEPESMLFSDL